MSDTESVEYLQTGFDPASLTVPRLRSILVSHNIPYPASAKKPQLIEIFNENVIPQARKIIKERTRAKRSSKGIVDAESSQEGTPVEDSMPPPPTPRLRSTRKPSSRALADGESVEAPARRARSPSKKTVLANSKHPRASDTETGADEHDIKRSVRKTRKNEASKVKVEHDEDDEEPLPRAVQPTPRQVENSAFSYDNPFQSGSSPLSGVRSPSAGRRKTVATPGKERRTTSSTSRRRTDLPQAAGEENIHPPTSKTFSVPVSALNGPHQPEQEDELEPTEEFTAEEEMELVRVRSQKGENAVVRRQPKKKQSSHFFSSTIWILLLTLLGGYAAWYRKEKLTVGYCGVGRTARLDPFPMISDKVQIPEWAFVLAEPECELCPQHAYCYQGMETRCEPDFVLKPHPLSLGGLVPLPPTCEPDGEKVRRVKMVADKAVEELRERRAKFECGELVDEQGVVNPVVEIEEDELKKEVAQKRSKKMGEVEFEELWVAAIGEIRGREEVESKLDGTKPLLSSTSLARVPLVCAIKRSARLTVERYRLQALILSFFLAILYAIRSHFATRAKMNASVPGLVSLTLDRLVEQARSARLGDEDEGWIAVGQLRDDVLRDEHNPKKRDQLWSKVRAVVEMNANVRARMGERNGEVSRVWEWIGAIGGIEGRRSISPMKSVEGKHARFSEGIDDSPSVQLRQGQKWDEGRPIY